MFLSFSVPESLLPAPDTDPDGDVKMRTTQEQEQELKPRGMAVPAVCAVEGARRRGSIGSFGIGSAGHVVRTDYGLRSAVELQCILVSLEILFWLGYPGLTFSM